MTIEEYLKSEMDYGAKMRDGTRPDFDLEEFVYYEGYIDAMSAVLEHLPSFDHDVTLKEVVKECLKHESDGGCGGCVLLREPSSSSPYYCEVGGMPAGWGIDRIERRMKEARK